MTKKIPCNQISKVLKAKKLVLVLENSTLITNTKKKTLALKCIFYICYPVQLKKNSDKIHILINFNIKINVIIPI